MLPGTVRIHVYVSLNMGGGKGCAYIMEQGAPVSQRDIECLRSAV